MASKYIQKFPIPNQFAEILNDLTREILRNQPQDIIEFSAQYFKCLQDGTVLDYTKKGVNIPNDFKVSVPKGPTEKSKDNKPNIIKEEKIIEQKVEQKVEQKAPSPMEKEVEKEVLKEVVKEVVKEEVNYLIILIIYLKRKQKL